MFTLSINVNAFESVAEPIWIWMLVLTLMLTLDLNDAIETNLFLLSANARVYTDVLCE